MLLSLAITALAVLPEVQGAPAASEFTNPLVAPRRNFKRCGQVSKYYGQHAEDWNTYKTGDWINNWWNNNTDLIEKNSAGFAGAFGQWALGDPDWTCRDDGSNSDCDLNLCDNRVLNGRGGDIRPTYYVLESVNRLHSYFSGLSQAFNTAALGAALSKDSWATTFYTDKDDKSSDDLKNVLNLITTIVGIGAAFAGLGPSAIAAAAGAGSAIVTGANGAVGIALGDHADDTFQKSADLGGILSNVVVESLKSFTTANNQLMDGQSYGNADIRSYISGGAFLDFQGVDKNAVTDSMSNMLIGTSINQLYRTQKIFILGGGACGDNQGIGSGPQESMICRDGKAWYLYYWQENSTPSLNSHQWGWVNPPPGSDKLGQAEYKGVSKEDILNSSFDAWNVAGYDYNADTAASRAHDAIASAWASPGSKGASWEGIFTVPVCDVSGAIGQNWDHGEWILTPYGHESRPVWCGDLCGDAEKTKAFINAAHLDGFHSPWHLCKHKPSYA